MAVDKAKLMALSLTTLAEMKQAISEVMEYKARSELRYGSVIEFTGKYKRSIRAVVDKIGPSFIHCTVIDPAGNRTHERWRVRPTHVKVVSDAPKPVVKPAIRPAALLGAGRDAPATPGVF